MVQSPRDDSCCVTVSLGTTRGTSGLKPSPSPSHTHAHICTHTCTHTHTHAHTRKGTLQNKIVGDDNKLQDWPLAPPFIMRMSLYAPEAAAATVSFARRQPPPPYGATEKSCKHMWRGRVTDSQEQKWWSDKKGDVREGTAG
jgi:hypothetical protein